jgi:hypothetical protein
MLDAIVHASAGELVAWTYPGDADAAEAAIEIVDARRREIRRLLGDRGTS